MDQASLNSLFVILFMIVVTIGIGIMFWRRYMPSTRPAPAPIGGGATPPAGTRPRLRDHRLFWPGVWTAVLIGAASIFYGPMGLLVIAALGIAGFGAWKSDTKAVWFTKIIGGLLLLAFFGVLILGPEGAKNAYDKFREGANDTVENGISLNFGQTRVDNNLIPTIDSVNLPRTAWSPQPVALSQNWRSVSVPRGYGSCYDDINLVEFRPDSTAAMNYVKSKSGNLVHVEMYFRPSTHASCIIPSN